LVLAVMAHQIQMELLTELMGQIPHLMELHQLVVV
jgi:hypothetical protein